MKSYTINPIGEFKTVDYRCFIQVDKAFLPALQELTGFSHLQIFWWFSECDDEASRKILEVSAPYRQSPKTMGVFATRSPNRPNPIALSTAGIIQVDQEQGILEITHMDAFEGTPILDLKPYTPSLDRVEHPHVPNWCAHWPTCLEDSASFDWEHEIK